MFGRTIASVGGIAALLIGCCLLYASGCQSANASVPTDADRATVAADLSYVSMLDRPVVWQPADEVTPSPAPLPVTPSRATQITLTGGTAKAEAFDIALAGNCADGSCDPGDDFGDRPRRPIVRAVGATGRAIGEFGRGTNRVRPIRRIGGFLFRRGC